MRKFLAVLCTMAVVAGTITPTPIWAADAYEFDGDIIENPYKDQFETTEAPTEKPTEAPTEEPTSKEEETTVVVQGPIKITSQPQDVELAAGYTVDFSVTAEGNGLTYQWYLSKDGGATWVRSYVTGAKTEKMTTKMSTSANGTLVKCLIKDADGNSIYTDVAKMILNETAIPDCSINILSQPVDGYAVAGIRTSFTVEATGNIAKYRWQVSKDGGATWAGTTVQGYNEPTVYVKVNASTAGRLVRCVITDVNGTTAISDTAEICMYENTIVVSEQPSNKYFAKTGAKFTVGVKATGLDVTYQWQLSKDGGATWSNTTVTGAKTDTITVTMSSSVAGRMVRCVITDSYGNKVTSSAATIIMSELEIVTQPTDVTATAGQTVNVSVKANGIGNTYQWQLSKDGGATWSNTTVTGAKTDTVTVSATSALNGRMLRCVITESTGNKVTSNAITLNVK